MIKNVFKICGFVAIFAVFSSTVFALNIQLIAPKKDFFVNDQFEVYFKVDAQGQSINAMAGTIDFPSDLLSVVAIKDGNSIVGKWVEKPVISNGLIDFAYIIPNGYKGVLSPYYGGYKPGKMFSVLFLAKKTGSGSVKISNGKAYLNDGNATKIGVHSDSLNINVSEAVVGVPNVKSPNSMDVLPPDKFVVLLHHNKSVFDGKWFLAFDAKDNGDGVDYYEVYESKSKGYSADGWVKAESPYILEDQNLSSYVYVKAVDKNGNSKIETLPPSNVEPWYNYLSFWIAIALGGLVVFFMFRPKPKKRK